MFLKRLEVIGFKSLRNALELILYLVLQPLLDQMAVEK